uniref:Uncharacterized protein n=1 Tax=Plectus sambesii TaxID=2011161 RepID=A0A914XJ69_9BILA
MTDDAGGQSALLSQQPPVALGHCRSAPTTPRAALRSSTSCKGPKPRATFNPNPQVIVVPGRRSSSNLFGASPMETLDHSGEAGLTDAELLQVKEDNQKRIKRIVAAVGIALTVISIVLVALSLSLGQKIDELVSAQIRETDVAIKGRGSRVLPNVGKSLNDGRMRHDDSFYLGAPSNAVGANSTR